MSVISTSQVQYKQLIYLTKIMSTLLYLGKSLKLLKARIILI